MVPLRASTTKSESLPDDPTAFVPSRPWNLPSIISQLGTTPGTRITPQILLRKPYLMPCCADGLDLANGLIKPTRDFIFKYTDKSTPNIVRHSVREIRE